MLNTLGKNREVGLEEMLKASLTKKALNVIKTYKPTEKKDCLLRELL